MQGIELAYAITNQYLFQEAKNNISNLSYFFATDPNTANNRLIELIIESVRNYDLSSMDLPLFQSILLKCGKTPEEGNKILNDIMRWKSYSKDQIEPARIYLQDICAHVIIQKAGGLFRDHPSEYLKYLKNVEFKTADLDIFSPKKFGEFDVNSLIAESSNSFIPSYYKWINDSFSPHGGYEKGQMVLITAAPGVGKSLFAMSESYFMASMGYKVLYVALGDLKTRDFIVRMGAMYSGLSFSDTYNNLKNVYETMSTIFGENLEISISPAGKVSADEIVEYVKSSKVSYDVIVIDYDGNLKGANAGDSMYTNYGIIYEKLNELVLMGKLLFICTQPKIVAWSNPVLEIQDVGESSKKQQTADMIIGIGKEVDSPNHLHTIKISKSRRGEEGVKCYTIRLNNGRFINLQSKAVYDQLKNIQDQKVFTEADISLLINQVMSTRSNMGNFINKGNNFVNSMPEMKGFKGGSPFGN